MLDLAVLSKDIKAWEDYMRNPAYKGTLSVLARYKFDRFKSYTEAGFTEDQAISMIHKDM